MVHQLAQDLNFSSDKPTYRYQFGQFPPSPFLDYFRLADHTYAMAHIRFQENYVPFVCGSTMPDEFWFQ